MSFKLQLPTKAGGTIGCELTFVRQDTGGQLLSSPVWDTSEIATNFKWSCANAVSDKGQMRQNAKAIECLSPDQGR